VQGKVWIDEQYQAYVVVNINGNIQSPINKPGQGPAPMPT